MSIESILNFFRRPETPALPSIPIVTIEGWVTERLYIPDHSQYWGMTVVRTFATEIGIYDELDIPAIKAKAESMGLEMCPKDLLDVIAAHHRKCPNDWEGTKFPHLDDSFYLLNRKPVPKAFNAVA